MPQEVQDFMKDGHASHATDRYVFDNDFLCGVHDQKRLSADFGMKSLILLEKSFEDAAPLTAEGFQSNVCLPLKVVETWHKLLFKMFGQNARELPATGRVLEYLTSRAGLKNVTAVSKDGSPLHGTGQNNPGILVARELWLELERMKQGSSDTVKKDAEKQEASGGNVAAEDQEMSADVTMALEEAVEEDPAMQDCLCVDWFRTSVCQWVLVFKNLQVLSDVFFEAVQKLSTFVR